MSPDNARTCIYRVGSRHFTSARWQQCHTQLIVCATDCSAKADLLYFGFAYFQCIGGAAIPSTPKFYVTLPKHWGMQTPMLTLYVRLCTLHSFMHLAVYVPHCTGHPNLYPCHTGPLKCSLRLCASPLVSFARCHMGTLCGTRCKAHLPANACAKLLTLQRSV